MRKIVLFVVSIWVFATVFDLELYNAIVSVPSGATGFDRAKALVARGAANKIVDADQAETLAKDGTTLWERYFLSFDPAPSLARLTVPDLVLNGSLDVQVPAKKNLAAAREAPRSNAKAAVIELPGIEETMSTAALEVISDWLDQTLSQDNRSRSFGPDACGPVDPAYIQTANETGSVPLFLQRSEAATAMHLVRQSLGSNKTTVFWATGTLEGKPLAIELPVDTLSPRMTFTFSGDIRGNQLKLTQPSGGVITQGLGNAEVTELNCARIITVSSPEPGVWHAEINGKGRYWLEAETQSDIHFIRVEFVEPGGRPGHEGLFRIAGQPVQGRLATIEAHVSVEDTKSFEFSLVSERGEVIQKLPLHAINEDRSLYELSGKVELPNVPFRVAMHGSDKNGKRFQRFFSHLFHTESVEVVADRGEQEVAPGITKQITFLVRNFGAARKFNIVVADAHKFVSRVEPKELTIGANDFATLRMDVTIPTGTASGTGDDVVIVVKSEERFIAAQKAHDGAEVLHSVPTKAIGAPVEMTEKPTSNSAIIHVLVTSSETNSH